MSIRPLYSYDCILHKESLMISYLFILYAINSSIQTSIRLPNHGPRANLRPITKYVATSIEKSIIPFGSDIKKGKSLYKQNKQTKKLLIMKSEGSYINLSYFT